mmetsp:Transcript_21938/g.57236  ORF Transcript_21938/g.57236 Transcript_21938/m.57236 type:complete len:260 (+) Transcript_21938:65-844(+)
MGYLNDGWDLAPHILNILTLLFLCLSVALVDWTTSDVRSSQGAFGTAEIGVWKACAEMNPVETPVFSVISSCRQGHCVKSETIATRTSRSNEGLCDRASAVGAFAILAIFMCAAAIFMTTFRAVMARTVLWWKGYTYNAIACFFSMIAWATWAGWQNKMNDQSAGPDDAVFFSTFEYGSGFNLQVTSCIFLLVNAVMCRLNAKNQAKAMSRARAHPNRERLNPEIPNYDRDEEDGSGLSRTATRRKGDDVVVMSNTVGL